MKTRKGRNRLAHSRLCGFTMAELLVVVAVISLFVLLAQ
ncbi:MAG: prepilin-type N-terminal cleavage/methylation domain-containing protein, partial [Planctomycetota bacterium]